MKNVLLTLLIFLNFNFSSRQSKETKFEKGLLQYFEKEYSIHNKQHLTKVGLEELRHPVLFSKNLLYVNEYILKSKKEIYSGINYFHFILYSHKDNTTPDLIMKGIDSLNKNSIEEKNYGPLGKDYNLFFAADLMLFSLLVSVIFPKKIGNQLNPRYFILLKVILKEWAGNWISNVICNKSFIYFIQQDFFCSCMVFAYHRINKRSRRDLLCVA